MARTNRPPSPSTSRNRNPSGKNQHGDGNLIDAVPDLPDRIQNMFDTGIKQKDIPKRLAKDIKGFNISAKTIQRYIKKYNIRTPRRSGLTDIEKGMAILELKRDDPLERWGCRTVKERLALKSVHVTRKFTEVFLQQENPEAAEARHPTKGQDHVHTLSRAGPNEEWGYDGHEKITGVMGVGIYGGNDTFSRLELGLHACPNTRDGNLPVAIWLRTVKKCGGMSVRLTCDMGTELGKLIQLVTSVRAKYYPDLDEDVIPAVTAVKSTKNITRERAWRPLWETELSNVAHEYKTGIMDAGYHPNDEFHQLIARWIWAQIVQARLDDHMKNNANHYVRKQRNVLLPTGGRRIDMYESPEDFGGKDLLLKIPEADIDRLLAEHDNHLLTQFGTDDEVALFKELHTAVGAPDFVARDGWSIFGKMVQLYRERLV